MVEKTPNFNQLSKEFEKFKTNLGTVLGSFERAREWADLSNCLQRIKKTFSEHPELPVPLKKDLAKRLAQCLNPDLNVIHSLTLEVYNLVFERELFLAQANNSTKIRFGADLALFYSGLFSFYQFAAFEVKKMFMDMIRDKILKFDRELTLCLPGFLVCMLPALEEQNTEQLKKIEEILLETEKIVGTSKFFGEIWKTIIRSPRCRLSAFKYLDRKIPKDMETAVRLAKEEKCVYIPRFALCVKDGKAFLMEQKNEGNYSDWAKEEGNMRGNLIKGEQIARSYFYFFYPNKEQLVIQALLAGLQIGDKNENYVNRATLDFMISHLQIQSGYLNDEERINLVEGVLCTLPKKDFASLKKFFTWFQGHLSEDEPIQKDEPAIKSCIEAIKRILKQFMDLKETKQDDEKNEMGMHISQSKTTLLTPITIIRNFMQDNFVAEPILEEISVDLIKYVKHYYTILPQGRLEDFKQKVANLFDMLKDVINCVWRSLGSQLSGEIRNVSQNISEEGQHIESVELISFFLKELNKDDKPLQVGALTMSRVDSIMQEEQTQLISHHQSFLDMITPIFSNLLSGVEKISNQMQNLEQAVPALDLIAHILEIMNSYRMHTQNRVVDNLQQAVDSFNKFYISILDFNDRDLPAQKRAWFNPAKKNQLYVTLKKASNIVYEIQRYADSNSFKQIPKWLERIIDCSCTKQRGIPIVLISIGTFLRIIETTEFRGNMKQMYELVKPQRGIDSNQKNYCMDIIKTLWSLLDESCDHAHVVQLLKQFDIRLPRIFSDVVTAELNSKERGIKYRAVKKFSIFWKLTANDYPAYKPFQPIALRDKDQVLDDESHLDVSENKDTDSDRRYIALQNMLQILDDDDPTLRLACRSWLTESQSDFQRILDPILNEFLDNNRVYKSFTGQIFFLENYEPKIVINNFGKLRNIILNTQNEFIEYIVNHKISEYVSGPFKQQFSHINQKESKEEDLQKKEKTLFMEGTYIQAIVYITLQFIVGQAVESLSSSLFIETQTVNASACEFMEQVMKSIFNKTSLSIEITHLIVRPLVNALRQAINNKNNAQQVHLLNLLQVIIIDGNFYSPSFESKKVKGEDDRINDAILSAKKLFKDDELSRCIVDGMKSSQAIVRYHYITFSEKIVQFMQQCIDTSDQKTFIKHIIECYCWLLQQADVTQYSTHFDRDPRHFENRLENQKSHIKNQKGQKHSGFAANVHINQENDIAQIFDGLKRILINLLDIEDVRKSDDLLPGESQPTQPAAAPAKKGMFFGLFGKSKKETNELDHVSKTVFDQMEDVMLAVINCWNSTDVFNSKDHFFTRLGVFPYSRDDDISMRKHIVTKIKEFQKQDLNPQRQSARIDRRESRRQVRDAENVDEAQNEPETTMSHRLYLRNHFNLIQKHIVDFLQPLTHKYADIVIHKTLNIWGMSDSFDKIGMSVNEGCEKIIQILLAMSISPYRVIESVQEYIKQHEWNCVKQKKELTLEAKEKESATTQSLYCQFVYQYLQQSISNHFQQHEYEEDGTSHVNNVEKEYTLLYEHMLKFFKCYIYSRSPITVCWLLETLHVLATKFKPEDSKLDKRIKMDYLEILDTLLKSATMIMQDSFGVKYFETFGINNISFSPTVYEMMKRYEFVKSKYPEILNEQYEEQLRNELAEFRDKSEVFGGVQLTANTHNINLIFNERQLHKYDEIPLQKGSLFEGLAIVRDPRQFFNCAYLSEFMSSLNNHLHDDSKPLGDERQRAIFKVFTIVTVRQILIPLVESIHGPDNKEGQAISMSIVLNGVTKVIETHIKQLGEPEKDKVSEKMIVINKNTVCEFLTEFLAFIASSSEVIQKNYKQEITLMFNEDKFFLLHERMLRQWQSVLSPMLKKGSDEIFEEQLLKFNKMEGFFTSKTDVFSRQSLTFKRLAFLVFSNKTDEFKEEMLDGLLKKMTEGFKNQEKNEDMKQQLFLLSRILMLRLKAGQLEDALRKLWPHLLNELVNVFDSRKDAKIGQTQLTLISEAILIIELMSALNIEDFQIDQWMFLFDGYGIAYQPKTKEVVDKEVETRYGVVDGKFSLRSKECFQPYMIQFMCKKPQGEMIDKEEDFSGQEMRFYKVDSNLKVRNMNTFVTQTLEPRLTAADEYEREFTNQRPELATMIPSVYAEGEAKLALEEQSIFKYVKVMQDSLAQSNMKRNEIDRTSYENSLEKEFIVKTDKK